MRGWVWRLYLGVGALTTGGYYLLPEAPRAVLNVLVGASATAAIAVGIAWHRPARRLAWWLIAAAQGLFMAGDALFSINELVLHIEPFPSLADALYLPGYPALAAGLALLALSRSAGRDVTGVIDAAIIAIGFGLLSWVLVMVPYSHDLSLGLVELLVSLAYPVGDVLLRPGGPAGHHPGAATGGLPAADRQPGGHLRRRHGVLGPGPAGHLDRFQRLVGTDLQVAAIAGAWAVLFILVMARMAGLVRGIERSEADRRHLLDQTMHAAEQERIRIAAELHDGAIQRLSVLSYDLGRAKQRVLTNHAAVARLEHAQAELSSEVQGLRELMASLRPPTLDEVGLEAALRDQVGAFTRHSGVDCSVRVALSGRLDSELETIVYRVTQEALLNVTRHARATRLWLELEGAEDRVQLSIRDDGVGFDLRAGTDLVRNGHFGLAAMRERVELAGGRFQLESRPGDGAVVRAVFTIPSAA